MSILNGWTLTQLRISDYMGIKALTVRVDEGGHIIKVCGPNGVGKTTAVDAPWAALCGTENVGVRPVREGATKATLEVELRDGTGEKLIVTKIITAKTTRLVVTNAEGMEFSSPQTKLDRLFSAVTIDPFAFSRLGERDKIKLLLKISGQEEPLRALDAEQSTAFDHRTEVNRDVKGFKEQLQALPADALTPVERTSNTDILDRLGVEQSRVAELSSKKEQIVEWQAAITEGKGDIAGSERRIAEYEESIQQLKRDIATEQERITGIKNDIDGTHTILVNAAPDSTAEIGAELDQVEAHNEKARQHREAFVLKTKLLVATRQSDELTAYITGKDTEKRKLLADSPLPIDDIQINGEELLILGRPCKDLCDTEKLEVGLRIGVAMNPGLRIMRIDHGAELDAKSWKKIAEYCIENDFQVIAAVVVPGNEEGGGDLYIEIDGEVK